MIRKTTFATYINTNAEINLKLQTLSQLAIPIYRLLATVTTYGLLLADSVLYLQACTKGGSTEPPIFVVLNEQSLLDNYWNNIMYNIN